MGFGAAAWKVASRDSFICWTPKQRISNLHLMVNNARFLILPWIKRSNLASYILSRVSRRLPDDWDHRYGHRPVLLETFVQDDLYAGTCYRAANWINVGKTQGRGKLDTRHDKALPIKSVFVYPFVKSFKRVLCY